MTTREFYTAIQNANVDDALKEFAATAIQKMDEKNKKRSSKPTKAQIENAPIKAAINEMLGSEPLTATQVAETLNISVQKASNLLWRMVEEGIAAAQEVRIKGKGKVKGYTLAE